MFFLKNKGISLIEIIIAIAILIILISVSTSSFVGIKENQVLKNNTEDILLLLNKARSQTLASLDSSEYGIYFSQSQAILFKGKVYSDGALGNEVINITTPVTISNISLGGTNAFYFNRLSGLPNTSGSITISNSNTNKIITISATGIISVN